LKRVWTSFWIRHSGRNARGRLAAYLASWFVPPYKAGCHLAKHNRHGYIAPSAKIYHSNLKMEGNVFIGDRVVIYQSNSGKIKLGKGVQLYSDIVMETGDGGTITVGEETHVQPRCQLMAYLGHLDIGCRVEIAPNCAFYPYDHGVEPGQKIRSQPLKTKGGIKIDDDAWLGVGVIVLDGVRIGKGAVIGAGSVVTKEIPDNAIAVGVPAKVIKLRGE
jgi:acetyltransferase-like isoleucine patch superfamily enzyme